MFQSSQADPIWMSTKYQHQSVVKVTIYSECNSSIFPGILVHQKLCAVLSHSLWLVVTVDRVDWSIKSTCFSCDSNSGLN